MYSKDSFNNQIKSYNIKASEGDLEKIFLYLELVLKYNSILNITGTRDKNEILKRHILDSLSFFTYFTGCNYSFDIKKQIIDIGTGGGLPGLVVAVFLKDSTFYLLDCRKKIINFLNIAIAELELDNVSAIEGRAEVLAHDPALRERFDIVFSRALGSVGIISELMLPFCAVGGEAIMYKSRKVTEELARYGNTILEMGGKIKELLEVKVPGLEEYRTLLVVKKETHTLYKYPRNYAKIIKAQHNKHKHEGR